MQFLESNEQDWTLEMARWQAESSSAKPPAVNGALQWYVRTRVHADVQRLCNCERACVQGMAVIDSVLGDWLGAEFDSIVSHVERR